jgi:hypothetical protein
VRGEVNTRNRSRDANAPELCLVIASEAKQSSGAMNARFVDLNNETAALDCFAFGSQ